MDLLLASLYRKTYYQLCTTTFLQKGNSYHALEKCKGVKNIRYRYEERNRMVINEVINDMIEKIEAQTLVEAQTQTPVQTPVVQEAQTQTPVQTPLQTLVEEQEKTNMDDSWCIDYGIDAVKIFHGHVPLCNVSDDSDDF
jgi:hypothetical protein